MKINIFENTLRITPFNENEPSIEITDEQYNQIINGDLIARNGRLVQNIAKTLRPRIIELKQQIAKYKEDVEQVELFGMQRDDYEQKKELCKSIVLQLRELESQLRESNNAIQQE